MLQYFRKNDPYRIIALVLLLIVTRVAYFILFQPTMEPATTHDSLISDDLFSGPLAVLLNQFWASLGSLTLLNVLLASVLILYNAVYVNSIFIRNASLSENTFIPAALYVFAMSTTGELYFLSPALIGSTFVLLSLNYLFHHIKFRGTEENILSTGFTIGLAALCYYPYAWLYLFVLAIYLIYSSTIRRRYYLMTWGFILPFLICWLIYFFLDLGGVFMEDLISGITTGQVIMLPFESIWPAFGLLTLLSLIALVQQFSGQGMTNHQILVQRSMSWLGMAAVLFAVLFGSMSYIGFVLIVPVVSYFGSMLLISLSRKRLAEILFALVLVAALASTYFTHS